MSVRTVRIIAFLCLYLVLTAGFQILVHTCGGETTVHMLSGAGDDPCGCGDIPEQDRCCTTQVITVHLDDVQQGAAPSLPGPDLVVTQMPPLSDHVLVDPSPAIMVLTAGTSPPPSTSPHILNCTFLI
jgi:hypothetical protein